ncbi:MAG: TldD/PmbA family protein, partial [Ignavibacteriales bacterium]
MGQKISRRSFLERSSKGIVAAAIIPHFLKTDLDKAFAMEKKSNMKLKDYLNHFGVDEKLLNDVMAEALSKGGEYCDLFFEHTIGNYIGLEDKAVNRAYTDVSFGVGIRVLNGDQTGYSFTEEITPKAMKLAAQTAANIANTSNKVKPVELKLRETPNYRS